MSGFATKKVGHAQQAIWLRKRTGNLVMRLVEVIKWVGGAEMQEIYERVWVANGDSCRTGDGDWSVVHACKNPCHVQAVGYQGRLPSTHPNYLILTRGQNLYLNLIDPPTPLFMPASFDAFLAFADQEWLAGRTLLIHCNQGESRAPSLALLFLAKRRSALNNGSYTAARGQFEKLYPAYKPGLGIQTYFDSKWGELGVSR